LQAENKNLRQMLQIQVNFDHPSAQDEIDKALQLQEQELHEREADKVEIENERVMNMVDEVLQLEREQESQHMARILDEQIKHQEEEIRAHFQERHDQMEAKIKLLEV
jgi:hypothetical protein